MKAKILSLTLFILLLFSFSESFSQKKKKVITPPLKIINVIQYLDKVKFPIFNITFKNYTDSGFIINRVQLELINFRSWGLSPVIDTRELTPIAYWDLNIPIEKGIYTYQAKYPILIAPKDAATVQIRIYDGLSGKSVPPQIIGLYIFKLFFLTTDNLKIGTDTLRIPG